MQKLSHIEINEICEELGENYPKSIEEVHGGDIHSAWRIEFSNKKLFLKRNIRNKKFLEFEKYCLQNLRKYINQENLVIPEVIAYKNIQDIEILLICFLSHCLRNYSQVLIIEALFVSLKNNLSNYFPSLSSDLICQ